MRPTVADQLDGTCRILETVVAPCVADPLARTILDNLIANLRMLTLALPKVACFLRDDNTATLHLLLELRDALPSDLVARIDQAAAASEIDVTDAEALDQRNGVLREILAAAVCHPGLAPDRRTAITSYMVDRASRVPMRYVPTAPAPSGPAPTATTKR